MCRGITILIYLGEFVKYIFDTVSFCILKYLILPICFETLINVIFTVL